MKYSLDKTSHIQGIILALIASFCFIVKNFSLWDWPSLDMATSYVKLVHPDWFKSDFLTQSMTPENGRYLFYKLTSWPILLGLDWYKTLYIFSFLNFMILPSAFYFGLKTLLINKNKLALSFLFFIISLIIIFENDFISFTTTAWWTAFSHRFHPTFFSITPLFFGVHFLYKQTENKKTNIIQKILGSVLTFFAFVIHPVYSLGGSIFLFLIGTFTGEKQSKNIHLLLVIASLLLCKLLFPSTNLSSIDYYMAFPALQPEHFIPSYFQALGNFSGYTPFILIEFFLLLFSCVLIFQKQNLKARIPFILFLFFIFCLLIQYVFVEKFPISKTIILISPSRFFAYMPWACIFTAALLIDELSLSTLLNKIGFKRTNFILFSKLLSYFNLEKFLLVSVVFISLLFSFGVFRHCEPESYLTREDKEVIQWIKEKTEMKSVFITPHNMLPVAIPLLTGRGIYNGNGFPYNDSFLKENRERFLSVWGNPMTHNPKEKYGDFYNLKDYNYFKQFSKIANFVILNKTQDTRHKRPLFQNDKYIILELDK